MRLWLVKRNGETSYDEVDAFVVAATSAEEAVLVHPRTGWQWEWFKDFGCKWDGERWSWPNALGESLTDETWVPPSDCTATFIGEAAPGTPACTVHCCSFNAG